MKAFAAVAMMTGGLSATALHAQARVEACVSPQAAESLVLVIAPDALRKASEVCAPVLPAGALLRRLPNPMIDRYAAESDAAWGQARAAIAAIGGEEAGRLLESEMARPLVATLIGQELTKEIKPRDCAGIDRILGLIEPLPPRNAAALVVAILQMSQKNGKKSPLPICAAGTRR
jgi:hypothetical protein